FCKRLTAADTGSYTFATDAEWHGGRCFLVANAAAEGNPVVDIAQAITEDASSIGSLQVEADDPFLIWMTQVDSGMVTAYPGGFTGGFNDTTVEQDNTGGGAYRVASGSGPHVAADAAVAAQAEFILTSLLAIAPADGNAVSDVEGSLGVTVEFSGALEVPTASVAEVGGSLGFTGGLKGSVTPPETFVANVQGRLPLTVTYGGAVTAPLATVAELE